MVLGAVLAGGLSQRFGSDKAVARLGAASLIEHVITALQSRTTSIVVCGRVMTGHVSVADRPGPGLGPLAGIAAALNHARQHDFQSVLTAPCDTPRLPDELLLALLTDGGPAYVASVPVIGLWPVSLADHIDEYLATQDRRSVQRWAAQAGARALDLGEVANINTVADLKRLGDG
jgi:molybdopterin-guanine dinucleotide biosynthesis protein A